MPSCGAWALTVSTMPTIFFYLLTLLGCALLYLSHRHQAWLRAPLPAWPARLAGACMLLLALPCGLGFLGTATTVFVWLVLQMLAFGLFPFIALLLGRAKA